VNAAMETPFELLMSKLSTSGNTKGAILRDD
jgi:hypothetical protein